MFLVLPLQFRNKPLHCKLGKTLRNSGKFAGVCDSKQSTYFGKASCLVLAYYTIVDDGGAKRICFINSEQQKVGLAIVHRNRFCWRCILHGITENSEMQTLNSAIIYNCHIVSALNMQLEMYND